MVSDVQVVLSPDEPAQGEPELSPFVEVVIEATGKTTHVPRDWIDNPVVGAGIEKTVAQKIADGEVTEVDVENRPTERDTVAVIEAFAKDAEIDLTGASTKAEKIAVIETALTTSEDATGGPPVGAAPGNPDVQLTGPVDDLPIIPAAREAELARRAATTTNPDGTESSDETPAAGEEEN